MRIAYLDCASGVSGDMTLGALVDAGVPFEAIVAAVDSLGLPSCRLQADVVKRKGFRATQVTVESEPEQQPRYLHHILDLIDRGRLSENAKELAKAIFQKLGEAEAKVHGVALQKVHFHEVGAVDSIADVVGAAVGWDLLGVERVHCSPIPTGCGMIRMDHGRLRAPAPATAELLKGVPIAESDCPFELTTPTGAAIVAALAPKFGPLPSMRIEKIGYGAGTKEIATHPNVLRLLVGEGAPEPTSAAAAASDRFSERIVVLETTLDDASGVVVGHVFGLLLAAGALDVQLSPVQMKKNRSGLTLRVLSAPGDEGKFEEIIFRETPSLGVRRWEAQRTALRREIVAVSTPWGPVSGKSTRLAGGPRRFHPEFEDCKALALRAGVPLEEVRQSALAAFAVRTPEETLPSPPPSQKQQPPAAD